MVLGAQLRRLRESAGIPRAEAGYLIRGSASKISRLELGRVSFKVRDIADLLTMYGVHDERERAAFLELVTQSNEPGWWHAYADLIPSWFQDFVGLEESASRIQGYESQYVPGLLQTQEYARALASHGRPDVIDDEVQRRVALRSQRQWILQRPNAPRLWVVIDEAALRRPIGGRAVLRAQLEVDVVQMHAEDAVFATRVPVSEADVLAPSRVIWQSSGDVCAVLDDVLALPEEADLL